MPQVIYTLEKRVVFHAAHRLEGLKQDHKCTRPHGHTYTATVELESSSLDNGFLIDAGLVGDTVKAAFDHQDLNEVLDENPTAENLARVIMQLIDDLIFRLGEHEDVRCTKVVLEESDSLKVTVTK